MFDLFERCSSRINTGKGKRRERTKVEMRIVCHDSCQMNISKKLCLNTTIYYDYVSLSIFAFESLLDLLRRPQNESIQSSEGGKGERGESVTVFRIEQKDTKCDSGIGNRGKEFMSRDTDHGVLFDGGIYIYLSHH